MSRSKRPASPPPPSPLPSEPETSAPAAVSLPASAAASAPAVAAAAPSASTSPSASASPTAPATAATAPPARGFAAFIKWASSNTQFFSSVIIGGAGLIATSLYQCNQAKLAQRQAESQQKIATEQAINNWRIERAKILSQNLQTLTARGGDNAEQRYGVLLSLSRGNILDPDLAVTYALELGKDNPEYMASVLANIEQKDQHHYRRLASAYLPTCSQRYGVSVVGLPICKDDRYAERSRAIAEVIADDAEPQLAEPPGRFGGPLILLRDEREVHNGLLRLVGLYSEFVEELYERRQWTTLQRLFTESSGASLVGSLALLMQSADLANSTDLEVARQLFDERERWLESYALSASCDADCRGRVLNVVLSHLGRGQAAFRRFLRRVMSGSRADSAAFIHRLQGRLSYCQIDPDQHDALRDEVIVPIVQEWLRKVPALPPPAAPAAAAPPGAKLPPGKTGPGTVAGASSPPAALVGSSPAPAPSASGLPSPPATPALPSDPNQLQIDDLLGLLSLLPQPSEPSAAWKKMLAELPGVTGGRQPALFLARHAEEYRRRKQQVQAQLPALPTVVGPPSPQAIAKPPVASAPRKTKNFCAVTTQLEDDVEEEE